ncbi:MAG: protein-L-isoaspartate(D-aspartate) O-methyltransferase [Thermoguttaceae bacterium]|jgi:protein-L-isoaspartate(D-aspartate) O-methyltransferase
MGNRLIGILTDYTLLGTLLLTGWAAYPFSPMARAAEPATETSSGLDDAGKTAPKQSASTRNRDPWAETRARLVEYEVVAAGVKDSRVCDAMRATPRHEFVPPSLRRYAYFDIGLPIGEGQTISSPFTVAYMTEHLQPQPTDKVLEIGTGSGYQAAVLSGLVSEVYSIEIVETLGKRAAKTLRRLGYDNVKTKIGDGYQGWPEHAPFDKIIVTCSPENIPKPLVDQLKEGGRLVVPLGQRYQQTLYLFKKVKGALQAETLQPTYFVPMMGRAEEERAVSADPGEPVLVNGDFQDAPGGQPTGWYYVRQAKVEPSGRTPGGKCLTFQNDTPGRDAQALQAVGVDGRRTREIEISLWVRALRVQPGSLPEQRPGLVVVFFNTNREPVSKQGIGPWSGDFDWVEKHLRIKVPASARLASVEVGLWGGTGQISVGPVALRVIASKPQSGGGK